MKIKTIFGQTKIPNSRTKQSTIWEKWEEDRLRKLKENYPTISEKEIIERYNQIWECINEVLIQLKVS